MSIAEAKALREAWAAIKEHRATDEQWLLTMGQPNHILDALRSDYEWKTSPYRRLSQSELAILQKL